MTEVTNKPKVRLQKIILWQKHKSVENNRSVAKNKVFLNKTSLQQKINRGASTS